MTSFGHCIMACFLRRRLRLAQPKGRRPAFSIRCRHACFFRSLRWPIEILRRSSFWGCRDSLKLKLFLIAGQTPGRARGGSVEYLASGTPDTVTVPGKATKKLLQEEKKRRPNTLLHNTRSQHFPTTLLYNTLLHNTSLQHSSPTLLYNTSTTTLLHNTSLQHFSTTLHYNTSLQHFSTTLLHKTSLQHLTATLLYNTSLWHFSTTLLHNTSPQHFSTTLPSQHFSTTLLHNTSLQHFSLTIGYNTSP